VNWEAVYLNTTVGGALLIAAVNVVVLGYYAAAYIRGERDA
jgi:hypothetical protein